MRVVEDASKIVVTEKQAMSIDFVYRTSLRFCHHGENDDSYVKFADFKGEVDGYVFTSKSIHGLLMKVVTGDGFEPSKA